MEYQFLDNSLEVNNLILPESDKINPFLLKNNHEEIEKAINFIASDEKFLYVHGFMGTGKRQFINYVSDFLQKDVIKLEYYCKESTVCDDILLNFIDVIENHSTAKILTINAKITTLGVKFKQYVLTSKKPFFIVLHSLDDVMDESLGLIKECFSDVIKEDNVKIIISTRAMIPDVLGDATEDRKIFLKALTQQNFKEYLIANQIEASDRVVEDFYAQTRGYYYYLALSVKIVQAMNITLADFVRKITQSGMTFDSFLGLTYINLVPVQTRNFFWFLRTVRHGLSINALSALEILDEFSVEYLKTNLMIFQSMDVIYVQDFFLQKIDISIPKKTQIKLHKFIIGIYEKQLKEPIKSRSILISRQAMRAEIDFHNNCIEEIQNDKNLADDVVEENKEVQNKQPQQSVPKIDESVDARFKEAMNLASEKKYTEAIEAYKKLLEHEKIDLTTVVEVRLKLAQIYKQINEQKLACHYYELVETYYQQHKEFINLNYLYYEMTDLYFSMYKNERAIETIKKVIYSVDTPQSLMVSACMLLGNIYSEISNPDEAYIYYKKALESLEENVDTSVLAELYFKFALANDDRGDFVQAFDYYNKCISMKDKNPYIASAYSNLASCYFENNNLSEAKKYFLRAYELEKSNNNYDGIYYNAYNIAKIYLEEKSDKAEEYLIEASKSADFLNEEYYIMESSLALGDYYYNDSKRIKEALNYYYKALSTLKNPSVKEVNLIEKRIQDMKLRLSTEDFEEIERKYAK